MTDDQLIQVEIAILNIYLPKLGKAMRKSLLKLCKEKGIAIYNPELKGHLINLACSIVRHRETEYDSIVGQVGKTKARFYTQPIVQNKLRDILDRCA